MKKRAKKSFSILLSLIMLLASMPMMTFSAFADDVVIFDDLDEFSEDVINLIRDAETTVNEDNFYGSSSMDSEDPEINDEYQTARIIVKSKKKINKLNAVDVAEGYNDLHVLQFATPEDAKKACEYYLTLDSVEYAQPDGVVAMEDYEVENEAQSIEEIIEQRPQLAEPAKQVGITALKEYLALSDTTYSRQIEVAVVDTGVESTHELLRDRVIPTGKNFSSDGSENSSEDNEGHGTHVAGIVAVNSLPNVKIKPYKVLDSTGRGTDIQVVLGVEAAIADGVEVINMSLGRQGENDALHESVKKAIRRNITVVVASGNDFVNLDYTTYTPACFPECITVIAHGDNCTGNEFSNYGSVCDIAAPGVNIYSSFLRNSYKTESGTSMASPLVAAAVTYVILNAPLLTPAEISETLKAHAVPEEGDAYSKAMCLYMEYITRGVDELSPPVFSRVGGNFDLPFMLTLSSSEENATIYYTRSEFSSGYYEVYTEPILIKYDTTVKAYAFRKGATLSEFVEHTYTKIFPNEDSKYIIDENGTIIEYLGEDKELFVPEVIQGIKVNAVGEYAFVGKKTLEYIVFPESVKTIGEHAFYGASNLKQVRAPGVEQLDTFAFRACKALESFEGNSLKVVGEDAFNGCSKLKYIDFSTVEKIEASAFYDTKSLTSLVSDTLTELGSFAFYNSGVKTVNISKVTKINWSTFKNCAELEKVNIPLVDSIEKEAFRNCTALVEINADNLDTIGRLAFSTCSSLEEIDFPRLTTFGETGKQQGDIGCFQSCSNLKKVNLPNATNIGGNIFEGCVSLEEIALPQAREVGASMFTNCIELKSVYLPKAITVYSLAFNNCKKLKEIELPSVTTINRNAFNGNVYIERLILPVVETISDLPEGVSVAIGSTVTTIENPSKLYSGLEFTIYGTTGTYANQWAKEFGVEFREINQENALYMDVPIEFEQNKETQLEVGVIGFNRTYQWYGNTQADNTTGTLIQGATSKTINPIDFAEYPYYYCVITSQDNTYVPVEIRTGVARNIHTHTEVEIPRVEPTCVLTGLTAGAECSGCGRILIAQEEIPTIPHDYKGIVTAPTCTEEGYTTYTCYCGRDYVDDYVPAIGHTIKEYGKVLVKPDCTEEGSKESVAYCVTCNMVIEHKNVTMPALGHTSAKAVEENYVAPSCTEKGSKDIVVYCSVCDVEISRETVVIDSNDHRDGDGDGYCDACPELLDPAVECECNCHKGGISGFFWSITRFFNKLFGTNQTCQCGIAHY